MMTGRCHSFGAVAELVVAAAVAELVAVDAAAAAVTVADVAVAAVTVAVVVVAGVVADVPVAEVGFVVAFADLIKKKV